MFPLDDNAALVFNLKGFPLPGVPLDDNAALVFDLWDFPALVYDLEA